MIEFLRQKYPKLSNKLDFGAKIQSNFDLKINVARFARNVVE